MKFVIQSCKFQVKISRKYLNLLLLYLTQVCSSAAFTFVNAFDGVYFCSLYCREGERSLNAKASQGIKLFLYLAENLSHIWVRVNFGRDWVNQKLATIKERLVIIDYSPMNIGGIWNVVQSRKSISYAPPLLSCTPTLSSPP